MYSMADREGCVVILRPMRIQENSCPSISNLDIKVPTMQMELGPKVHVVSPGVECNRNDGIRILYTTLQTSLGSKGAWKTSRVYAEKLS